jgi:GrpB-like predicted nucleotidyltransferase (UPF0157 family)
MKIEIENYDPLWPKLYEQEKEIILNACVNKIHSIEHVGSTSVPGLGAKPIIDILLGVTNLKIADSFIPNMIDAGYEYVSKYEDVMPERRYFVKRNTEGNKTHHVHTVEVGSDFWKRHLLFRDYLRINDDARDRYWDLKKELSMQDWNDRNDYTDAKTEFIRSIETKAIEYFSKR